MSFFISSGSGSALTAFMNTPKKEFTLKEQYYLASQWQLMRRKFFKHKLGIFGLAILMFLYSLAIFCEFVSPYTKDHYDVKKIYIPEL